MEEFPGEMKDWFDAQLQKNGWEIKLSENDQDNTTAAIKQDQSIVVFTVVVPDSTYVENVVGNFGYWGMNRVGNNLVPAAWPKDAPIPDFCEVSAVFERARTLEDELSELGLIHQPRIVLLVRHKDFSGVTNPERFGALIVMSYRQHEELHERADLWGKNWMATPSQIQEEREKNRGSE